MPAGHFVPRGQICPSTTEHVDIGHNVPEGQKVPEGHIVPDDNSCSCPRAQSAPGAQSARGANMPVIICFGVGLYMPVFFKVCFWKKYGYLRRQKPTGLWKSSRVHVQWSSSWVQKSSQVQSTGLDFLRVQWTSSGAPLDLVKNTIISVELQSKNRNFSPVESSRSGLHYTAELQLHWTCLKSTGPPLEFSGVQWSSKDL